MFTFEKYHSLSLQEKAVRTYNPLDASKDFFTASGDKIAGRGKLAQPRGQILLDKIKKKTPMIHHASGKEVIISQGKIDYAGLLNIVRSRDKKALKDFLFADNGGTRYRISDFSKTAEFGGVGKGISTQVEDKALQQAQQKLKDLLAKHDVPFIYLKVGNRVQPVAGMRTEQGTPKSDFNFVDINGKDMFFISHKDKKGFQQYGGLPEIWKFGKSNDTKKFIIDAVKHFDTKFKGSMEKGEEVWRPVMDDRVWKIGIFGKEYKKGNSRSKDNVDGLFEGELRYKESGKVGNIPRYELLGETNNTMLHDMRKPSGFYEPVYFIRVERGKTALGRSGLGSIKNARAFVYPKGNISPRIIKSNKL